MADLMIRVQSIPAFWQGDGAAQSPEGRATSYRFAMEALWRGIFSLRCPVRFVIGSDGNECHVGFGADRERIPGLLGLLQGAFPGLACEASATGPGHARWPHSALLSGTPSGSPARLPSAADQVIRAMTGRSFLLVEEFTPASAGWLEDALHTMELQWQENEYELRRLPADSRLRHVSEQLDFNIRRLRAASIAGGWRGRVITMAERPEDLATLCHLLRAAWSERGPAAGELQWNQPARATTSGFFLPSDVVEAAILPTESHAGFRVTSPGRLRTDARVPDPSDAQSILLGDVLAGAAPNGQSLTYPASRLFEHFGIFGRTGTGKSTALRLLLSQCWDRFHIPFLLIEPSIKREFRGILAERWAAGTRLFPVGESGCALQFNLLEPQGVPLATHIGHLRALLLAAFAWVTPQQYILSQALTRVYEWFGFDLATGTNRRGAGDSMWPTIEDLIRVIPAVVAESRYDREISGNLVAGLTTRLRTLVSGPLGTVLCSRKPIRVSELLDRPAVVEMALLGDDEQKCLLMGALLLLVAEHRMSSGAVDRGHLLIIEEAHRLLRRTSVDQRDDNANARGHAVGTFASLSAELRAFRQGVGVVEQSPLLLHPEVLANSNLKIAFQLPDAENLERMAAEFRLDRAQAEHLAFAQPGIAAVFGSQMPGAYMVRFPQLRSAGVTPEQVREHLAATALELGTGVEGPLAVSPCESAAALALLLTCATNESPAAVLEAPSDNIRLAAVAQVIRGELRDKGLHGRLRLDLEDRIAEAWARFLRASQQASLPECEAAWRDVCLACAAWTGGAGEPAAIGAFESRRLAALLNRSRDASAAWIANQLPVRARRLLRDALSAPA